MVATVLSIGDVAIIAANTEDNGNPQMDLVSFILLKPIGIGTVIFFTDRAWNGTTFAAAGGGDGTFTYTAGADLPAGTVVTITQAQLTAAGINLSDAGDTIYVYQGTTADAPTRFLHAVDIGDAVTGFPANTLLNTGLVSGTSAVAFGTGAGILDIDNAEFGGRTHNIQMGDLFTRINTATSWTQNSNSPQDGTASGTPAFTAPDAQIWVAGSGGGNGIVTINLDATFSAGTLGYQIAQAFQNAANLFHPSDITLDTVEDKYFFVDSNASGTNRIIQGSISQLLANPSALTTTVLYTNAGSGSTGIIQSIAVDTVNNKIYFDIGTAATGSEIRRIDYNTASQAGTLLATLGADHYVTQMAIDFTRGEVFLATSVVDSVFGSDAITQNYIYRATAAGGTAAGLASAATLTFTTLAFSPNDTGQGPEGSPLAGNAFPVELGYIRGIDVDPVTHALLIVTGSASLDNDGNGIVTYNGGIFRYLLDANPTGTFTTLFTQTGTPGAAGTGPRGLLYYIEVDAATGKYYVIDETGLNADPGDASIYTGSLTVAGTPTLLGVVANINGLGARGLEILHAPTLTGTNLAAAITETGGNPSPDPTAVAVANAFTASDSDSSISATDQLAGAQVRVSAGFQSGVGHQDVLSINGALPVGITASYNSATGVLTLTGISTFANYQTALAQVRFTVQGDNPTNYGVNTTRTLSFSTFDGALYSDEVTATVALTAVNDAPINTVGGTLTLNEDALATAFTGVSINDVDADPATAIMTVTFTVVRGTISLNTAVANGVTAGQITAGANGTTTITVQATQNAINATLANATGLTYTPTSNVNGADTLTITTNDGGATGNDPGLTGTGTTEQDSDTQAISVTAVNDAPVATGATTATAVLEDSTPAGQTVSALFGGNYTDPTDQVAGGSSSDAFAGIAITANVGTANGVWQYFNGAAWTNIVTGMTAATAATISASTLIRFLPANNFNGAAPTLTATLVDASGGALTNGASVNASVTGGTTRFSAASVVLSHSVTAVNDAPTSTGLQGDSVTTTEPAGATSTMPTVKIDLGGNATISEVALDNVNFAGGSIRFAITANLAATQDQLNIDTAVATTVTVAAGIVSVGGTAIGTVTGGGAGGADLVVALNANATPARVQVLIRAIDFANTGGDNPTAGARTITTTLIDGGGTANGGVDTLSMTSTVTVVATNDVPVAVADSNNVLENGTIVSASVFGNDGDPDGPALSVSAVNGVAGNVGNQFTLASGATVTLRANGTYDYNPNGAFNTLVSAATALATGAVNSSAADSFTYTLTGGNTVSVTITVNGVQSSTDQLGGDAGNNTITGTALDDVFNLSTGGNDTVSGGNGNDAFIFGVAFTAADTVDGGAGTNDQVGLSGNYSGGIVLGPNTLTNIEVLAVLPGFSYNITSNDGNVAAGQTLSIFGGNLGVGNNFSFNGSAETNGMFRMYGGLGDDSFIGGALDDGFYFGPGKWGATDAVVGNGGTNDQLALDGDYSIIIGANAGVETLILLPGPGGTPNNFNITLSDVWTGAAATKTVWGLNVTTALTIDGSAETNGNFIFFGGQGSDTLTGGAGTDAIFGGGGGDALRGGLGNDTFRYDNLTDSFGATNATRDRILDFTAGDKIDLSRIDAITGGADDAFTFIGSAAFGNVAGQLRFTDVGGGIFNIEGDVNGDGFADFAILVTAGPAYPFAPADFVL